MRLPLSWLKDYVEFDVPVVELAKRMTLAGLEVETVEYVGLPGAALPWGPDRILVGAIKAVRAHPDADRLVLAEVEYGGRETEVVVTGAPSLLELCDKDGLSLKVAFALEGASLYDGHSEGAKVVRLKKTKIRGVPSRAMVCSEKELGLSGEQIDILYLPDDAPVGTPLVEYIGDAVLDIDVKGPFAHLQSVFGIAREVAALTGGDLDLDPIKVAERHPVALSPSPEFLELEIADPDLCPRYTAAFIGGVEIKPSPFWIQLWLRLAGMRPINNVVDITNFVMLELGQPLHAFDYRVLRARKGADKPAIIVRRAKKGEKMATLDGEMRTFDEEMLLITDGGGPVAVAGVMGGLDSEVTEDTTEILLESANFEFLGVRRTSRLLGLSTESSQRFGRQVDPELALKGAARAAHLIAELGGGKVANVIGDAYPGAEEQRVIRFDDRQVERVLGIDIPTEEIVRILTSLQFEVSQDKENRRSLSVTVPSHRRDVTRPIDLVEEVGRIWGYDRFPTTLMRDELPPQRANVRLEGTERVRDLLTGCGLDEVITYSLVDIKDEAKLDPAGPPPDPQLYLGLLNPLSPERAHLRQKLLPSLLRTIRSNLRFLDRAAIFEVGAVYLPVEGQKLPDEPQRLAVVITGPREPVSWIAGQDRQPVRFFDLKGVVEALVAGLGLSCGFRPCGEAKAVPAAARCLDPGRCALVSLGEQELGVMGELHPAVRAGFELPDQPVCALEFDLEVLLSSWGGPQVSAPISAHPPVYEDLALVVDEEVEAARVGQLITETGSPVVRSVVLFDVFRGGQVGAGKKSLAYHITYQADDRTLTDREVARLRDKIVRRLEGEVGAELRS
jgi:phenylalanyl-tRNA synthetase beta chain